MQLPFHAADFTSVLWGVFWLKLNIDWGKIEGVACFFPSGNWLDLEKQGFHSARDYRRLTVGMFYTKCQTEEGRPCQEFTFHRRAAHGQMVPAFIHVVNGGTERRNRGTERRWWGKLFRKWGFPQMNSGLSSGENRWMCCDWLSCCPLVSDYGSLVLCLKICRQNQFRLVT